MDDRVGGGEVQSRSAGFEADQKEGHLTVLKTADGCGAVTRLTGQQGVVDLERLEFRLDQVQHADELREEQHAAPFLQHLGQHIHQGLQFGGVLRRDGWGRVGFGEPGIAADLSQFQQGREDRDLRPL